MYNKNGVLLCLDFQKAFDTVNWEFIIKVLQKLNFGTKFIRWMEILYNDPSLVIKNNGWISKDVKINRGIRQGCPISALLFIIVVEILAINIRSNKNIKGYKIKKLEVKISQYADDSTILLDDINSIKYVIDIVNKFGMVAGKCRKNRRYFIRIIKR